MSFRANDAILKSGSALQAGAVRLYPNVITIDGQSIDAIVRTVSVTGRTIESFDPNSSPNVANNSDADWFILHLASGSGSALLEFEFIEGGSFNNATLTGRTVTLQNVVVNSFDIDGTGSAGTHQFTEFGGFSRSQVSSTTLLSATLNATTGLTQFLSTVTTNNTANPGTHAGDRHRVRVIYDELNTFRISMGSGSGLAYFGLQFAVGVPWGGLETTPGAVRMTSSPSVSLGAAGARHMRSDYAGSPVTLALTPMVSGSGTGICNAVNASNPMLCDTELHSVEAGTTVDAISISFNAADIPDPSSERLQIDAQDAFSISLDFGNAQNVPSLMIAGRTFTVSAVVANGVKSLTFQAGGGGAISVTEAQTLLSAIAYDATAPADGERAFRVQVRSAGLESPVASSTVNVSSSPAVGETGSQLSASASSAVAGDTGSVRLAVQLRDAHGNPLAIDGVSVTFSTTLGTLSSDSAQTNSQGFAEVTLTSTQAGTATVTASIAGIGEITNGSPATVAFLPGPAALFVITDADGEEIGTQAAGRPFNLLITAVDTHGNVVTSHSDPVLFSLNRYGFPEGDTVIADSFVEGVASWSGRILVADTGFAITATQIGANASGESNRFAVAHAELDHVRLVGDTTALRSGDLRDISALLLDAYGNPVTTGPGASAWIEFAMADTLAGSLTGLEAVQADAGVAVLSVAGARAGRAALDGWIRDSQNTDRISFDVTPGEASALVIVQQPTASVAGEPLRATDAGHPTVRLTDANGNAIEGMFIAAALRQAAGTNFIGHSVTQVATDGDGLVTFDSLYIAVAGTYSMEFSVPDADVEQAVTDTFAVVTTGIAMSLELAVGDTAFHSGDSTTFSITLYDDLGNVVDQGEDAERLITFMQYGNGVQLVGLDTVRAAAGRAIAQAGGTSAGYAGVLAYVRNSLDSQISDTVTVRVLPGPVSADMSSVTARWTTMAADSTNTVTVQLRDAAGNPAGAGESVYLVTSSGTLTPVSGVADSAGTFVSAFTSSAVGGATVQAHAGADATGALLGSVDIDVVAGSVSPSMSTVTAAPAVLEADGRSVSVITVQLVDGWGNPVTDAAVNVTLELEGHGTLGDVSNVGDGTFTATLTAPKGVGTARIRALTDGVALTHASNPATVQFVPGEPAAGTSIANVPDGVVGKVTRILISVLDRIGNEVGVGGADVAVSVGGGNGGAHVSITDRGDGAYLAEYTPLTAGVDSITVTINGAPVGGSPFPSRVKGDEATALRFIAQPAASFEAGSGPGTLIVHAVDAFGNVDSSFQNDVSVSITPGTGRDGAQLFGTVVVKAVNGIAMFDDLTMIRAGEDYTLTASTSSLSSGESNPFTVYAGPPLHLEIREMDQVSGPVRQPDGGASLAAVWGMSQAVSSDGFLRGSRLGPFVMVLLDQYSNETTPVGGELPVTMTSSSPTGRFFLDRLDEQPVAQLIIPMGSSYHVFYYEDPTPGSPVMNGDPHPHPDSPPVLPVSRPLVIRMPESLGVTPSESTTQLNVRVPLKVGVFNGGEPVSVPAPGLEVSLESNSATGRFYRDPAAGEPISSLEITAALAIGMVYYADSAEGVHVLTLRTASLPDGVATAVVKVGDGFPMQTSAVVPDGEVGSPTVIVVTLLEGNSVPVMGMASAITVAVAGANANATVSSVTDNGDGTYTVSYIPVNTGTDHVSILVGGEPVAGSPFASEVRTEAQPQPQPETGARVPGAPSITSATAGLGEITVTWNAPDDEGSSPVTDYIIQYSTDGGVTWRTYDDGVSTARAATITGLGAGGSFLLRVAAVNGADRGAYSSPWGPVTVAEVTPDLTLSVEVDNATPAVGDTVVATVTITNRGLGRADDVVVTSALTDQRLTVLSVTVEQGSYVNETRTWRIGSVAPAASVRMFVRAIVTAGDTQP